MKTPLKYVLPLGLMMASACAMASDRLTPHQCNSYPRVDRARGRRLPAGRRQLFARHYRRTCTAHGEVRYGLQTRSACSERAAVE
jgi:hypothetical protein